MATLRREELDPGHHARVGYGAVVVEYLFADAAGEPADETVATHVTARYLDGAGEMVLHAYGLTPERTPPGLSAAGPR